jgi:hypothetical protein
MVEAEVGVAGG